MEQDKEADLKHAGLTQWHHTRYQHESERNERSCKRNTTDVQN